MNEVISYQDVLTLSRYTVPCPVSYLTFIVFFVTMRPCQDYEEAICESAKKKIIEFGAFY
jgi:hypothetical protein